MQRVVTGGVRRAPGSAAPGPTCIGRSAAWASAAGFRLSARRNRAAAQRFLRQALRQPGVASPRTSALNRNPACPRAVRPLKRAGQLWRLSRLRQRDCLNSVVEQDRRRMERLVRPGLGLGSLRTARRTLAGCEAMAMVRKGQVPDLGGRNRRARAPVVAGLFGVAA